MRDDGINQLYVQRDASHNVIAIVPFSDSEETEALERYLYDPYGNVTYLNGDGSAKETQASDYNWVYLHQGLRLDTATGQYDNRSRIYDPGIGDFTQQDRIGYADGMNLYQYERSSPPSYLDPIGTDASAPSIILGQGPTTQPATNLKCDCTTNPIADSIHALYGLQHRNSDIVSGLFHFQSFPPFEPRWDEMPNKFISWATGESGDAQYLSGSGEVDQMKRSSIAANLRKFFLEKNKDKTCKNWAGVTNFRGTFGSSEFVKDLDNPTAHFVGSATGTATIEGVSNGKVTVRFKFTNTTSLTSFLYTVWPNKWNVTTPGRPFSNCTQTYEWKETFDCHCD